jgi:hypothetical protein
MTLLTLCAVALGASQTTLARDYGDERPVYVRPQPPVAVSTRAVVIGWHGHRYWDG